MIMLFIRLIITKYKDEHNGSSDRVEEVFGRYVRQVRLMSGVAEDVVWNIVAAVYLPSSLIYCQAPHVRVPRLTPPFLPRVFKYLIPSTPVPPPISLRWLMGSPRSTPQEKGDPPPHPCAGAHRHPTPEVWRMVYMRTEHDAKYRVFIADESSTGRAYGYSGRGAGC
ncbi:hypothetical protein BD779DRAFT_225767 [Infundibulicybe gibba]|nr:hypothetical protein BD779DRAFT_225767 [Infundibulicybe gibba]